MAVRNCSELGENLQNIVKRLMANDNLVNLLYYTDKDPLSQPHLTDEEKRDLILHKLIKVVPKVGAKEIVTSLVTIEVVSGITNGFNKEFKNIKLSLEVFTPVTQWLIKSDNLRPFLILGEIEKSLKGKTVNGLGRLEGGDFELNFLTEEISSYKQVFTIIQYD